MAKHQNTAARFFVTAFGVVILTISAVTTFSFFASYFTSIFPVDMLGAELAALLAGGAGVILFDLATVYWLNTFLKHAETTEQRAVSLLMIIFTFAGAAAASIAQLGLAASGDVALDPATRQSIANAAVWTVIAGVVANFGANVAYTRFSIDSKERVREADRRDLIQGAEDEQATLLDTLIAQEVKGLIAEEAPTLAKEQAARLVDAFRAREMAKYAGRSGKPVTPGKPATPPTTPERSYRVQRRENGRWETKVSYPDQGHALDVARTWRNELETDTRVLTPDGTEIVVYVHTPDGRETTPDSSQETEAERQRAYAAQNREYANRNEERAAKLDAARERVIAANGNGHTPANFTRGGL